MGSVSVPYHRETGIRFQVGLASAAAGDVPVCITTDLVGTGVMVVIGDARYRVDLADVATAIVEAERPDLVPTPAPTGEDPDREDGET